MKTFTCIFILALLFLSFGCTPKITYEKEVPAAYASHQKKIITSEKASFIFGKNNPNIKQKVRVSFKYPSSFSIAQADEKNLSLTLIKKKSEKGSIQIIGKIASKNDVWERLRNNETPDFPVVKKSIKPWREEGFQFEPKFDPQTQRQFRSPDIIYVTRKGGITFEISVFYEYKDRTFKESVKNILETLDFQPL